MCKKNEYMKQFCFNRIPDIRGKHTYYVCIFHAKYGGMFPINTRGNTCLLYKVLHANICQHSHTWLFSSVCKTVHQPLGPGTHLLSS
jgi:hypothetical protein